MTALRTVEDAQASGTLFEQSQLAHQERPVIFLQREEVERRVAMSKTTIYRKIAAGSFPAPVRDLETGSVWWIESEIIDWQRARIRARDVAAHT